MDINCQTFSSTGSFTSEAFIWAGNKIQDWVKKGYIIEGCNSLVMLLKLLKILDVDKVTLAGADGFTEGRKNYYSSDYKSHLEYGSKYNTAVADAIRNIGIGIRFITPSAYEK